jgi:hypothetical protein
VARSPESSPWGQRRPGDRVLLRCGEWAECDCASSVSTEHRCRSHRSSAAATVPVLEPGDERSRRAGRLGAAAGARRVRLPRLYTLALAQALLYPITASLTAPTPLLPRPASTP